jgi:predicted DNA-binding transcriptional regulator AlpA
MPPLNIHAPADPAPPSGTPTTSAAETPEPAALLLTARQAAALCAVSVATWWRWDAAGRCPAAVRIGPTVRWRRGELESCIAGGCPCRREWMARRGAAHANGRPR